MIFKVGDKVSLNKGLTIGTVIRITEKRQDVVVDFGRYCEKFSQTGREIGGDSWHYDTIYPLTEEIEKEILDKRVVAYCKKILSDASNYNITPDKARKIINFFKQEIFE